MNIGVDVLATISIALATSVLTTLMHTMFTAYKNSTDIKVLIDAIQKLEKLIERIERETKRQIEHIHNSIDDRDIKINRNYKDIIGQSAEITEIKATLTSTITTMQDYKRETDEQLKASVSETAKQLQTIAHFIHSDITTK